jgi:hypothetical protein
VLLSNIEHRAQRAPEQREADCLVACAAMVLDYLGIRRQYGWLSRVMKHLLVLDSAIFPSSRLTPQPSG